MTCTPVHTDICIKARRLHISMISTLLKKAKQDDRDLRKSLGDGARGLMKHWIRQLDDRLSDLGALQCEDCGIWIHESTGETVEFNENEAAQCAEDQVMRSVFLCQDCIDCPWDEQDQ